MSLSIHSSVAGTGSPLKIQKTRSTSARSLVFRIAGRQRLGLHEFFAAQRCDLAHDMDVGGSRAWNVQEQLHRIAAAERCGRDGTQLLACKVSSELQSRSRQCLI